MKKISVTQGNISSSIVKEVVEAILKGGIVALPTETVYGLAVDPSLKEALARLYEVKQRPQGLPLTIALANSNTAMVEYFSILPPFGYRMIEKFWPGPLTIVYFDKNDNKIGIRIPSDPIAKEILSKANKGLYLTSANLTGKKEAVSGSDVEAIFDGSIDFVIDSGNTLYQQSSTVVDLTLSPFNISRQGVISEQQIIDVFIRKRILFICAGNSCRSPMAQFLLEKYLGEAKPYLRGRHEIISRGIVTIDGLPASAEAINVLRNKEDIDMSSFTSKKLDRQTVLSSDLIFTMEDAHTDYILKFEPTAEGRVFGLQRFLPPESEKDILDPIGRGVSVYNETYEFIKKAILELTTWL